MHSHCAVIFNAYTQEAINIIREKTHFGVKLNGQKNWYDTVRSWNSGSSRKQRKPKKKKNVKNYGRNINKYENKREND